MKKNLINNVSAIQADIKLTMTDFLQNKTAIGFLVGIIVATLIAGFIITKNPRHIPTILRYSSMDAFQKIAKRDKRGTYQMAFTTFIKMYTQIRTLVLISIISFFVMVTTIVVME